MFAAKKIPDSLYIINKCDWAEYLETHLFVIVNPAKTLIMLIWSYELHLFFLFFFSIIIFNVLFFIFIFSFCLFFLHYNKKSV